MVLAMVKEIVRQHNQLDVFYRKPETMKNLSSDVGKWLRERRGLVLVAEIDGKVIGYVRGSLGKPHYFARESEVIAYVDDLLVNKQYRRQKIGEQLLVALLKWFRSRKVTTVMLYVDVRNDSAIKFWERMGFSKFTLRMKRDLL